MTDGLRIFLDTTTTPSGWVYRLTGGGRQFESGAITSLDALSDVLSRHGAHLTDVPWTELPTFGGPPPPRTDGVWSWDERRLLVGPRPDSLQLHPRDGQTVPE
ncbi:hypothetical protein [Archangium lansingense]|uniref:Uncharacterized protein n=1 Tax=Archangium lansingense TaxID=2995310 RepID=A0ABT4ABU3_9BACT|nr:hypothetical protein [Archangium lansinium]MCY1079115.1 hypothetical protein [Archangium lansinium]